MDNIARNDVWNDETKDYIKDIVVAIEPSKHLDKFRDRKGFVRGMDGRDGPKEANSCARLGKRELSPLSRLLCVWEEEPFLSQYSLAFGLVVLTCAPRTE